MSKEMPSLQIKHKQRREKQLLRKKQPMLKAKVNGHTDLTPFNAVCRIRHETQRMIVGD